MSAQTVQDQPQKPRFRFSGHDTFPCRYTWLPKAVQNLRRNNDLFADEDQAMVRLGVGKNMVRAIRFWADAADVAVANEPPAKGFRPSEFGEEMLGPGGHDQYLEDLKTLWLIHWKLSTSVTEPLFAWHFLLNSWHRPDFTRSEVLSAFTQEAERLGKSLSAVTLEHHFTTFLHSYVPTRSKKGEVLEDNLDCPLVELELLQTIGERPAADSNRHESIYAFRVEEKPDISPELFIYCLDDFWNKRHPQEKTLSFRDIAVGECSPGQIFKLPEHDIRDRLECIEKDSAGKLLYQESAAFQHHRLTPSHRDASEARPILCHPGPRQIRSRTNQARHPRLGHLQNTAQRPCHRIQPVPR
ncbi:MAG: DUF4007 family protein [Verrucomicrobiota bacterium]|jgi:hypothetical protein